MTVHAPSLRAPATPWSTTASCGPTSIGRRTFLKIAACAGLSTVMPVALGRMLAEPLTRAQASSAVVDRFREYVSAKGARTASGSRERLQSALVDYQAARRGNVANPGERVAMTAASAITAIETHLKLVAAGHMGPRQVSPTMCFLSYQAARNRVAIYDAACHHRLTPNEPHAPLPPRGLGRWCF